MQTNRVANEPVSLNVYPVPEIVYLPIQEWEEEDIVVVIDENQTWKSLQSAKKLEWDVGAVLDAPDNTEHAWKQLVKRCDGMGEIVYATGGQKAIDAAKYVSQALDMPLIALPYALNTDSMFSWYSKVKEEQSGKKTIRHVETIPPEIVLLDEQLIRKAHPAERVSAVLEVLGMATASVAWQKNPHTQTHAEPYNPADAAIATALFNSVLREIKEVLACSTQGIRRLVSTLVLQQQLSNLSFHSQLKDGPEHWFAYCGETLPALQEVHYTQLLASGLLHTAQELQDATLVNTISGVLKGLGLADYLLKPEQQQLVLQHLPEYTKRHLAEG